LSQLHVLIVPARLHQLTVNLHSLAGERHLHSDLPCGWLQNPARVDRCVNILLFIWV
jgi:hypothetical protein